MRTSGRADVEHARRRAHALQRRDANPGHGWYQLRNVATDETELRIYDEIGGYGVTADALLAELRDVSTPQIRLRINSPGGDVFDGIAIYNALASHPARVTSVVDGVAASAASFIALAGDEVHVYRNARLMIHDAHGLCVGNAADMREMTELLDMASDNIADIYAQRAGGTVEDWRATMRDTRWYTAEEAVAAGLADVVLAADGTPQTRPDHPDERGNDEPGRTDETDEELPDDLDVAALLREAFTVREAAQ